MAKSKPQNPYDEEVQRPWQNPSAAAGLPHSREAEEAVVGAVLINPYLYEELEGFLKPNDFYIHRLRFIWEGYVRLHQRAVPIDILTISEELDDMGRLDEIGGQAYLMALLNQVPTTLHAEAYGKMVKATAARRDLLVRANQIAEAAYDPELDIEAVLAEYDKIVNAPIDMSMDTNIPAEIAAFNLLEKIQRVRSDPHALAVPIYGMQPLQNALGGWPRKAVTLVYGDSSIGKTALMLQIAEATAQEKLKVLYVTLESKADTMVSRRVFGDLGIDGKFARSGDIDDSTEDQISEGIRTYMEKNSGYLIFNEDTWTVPSLSQAVRNSKPDLVIVDYLGEMSSDDNESNETRILLKNLRGIKRLAKRQDAAFVVIHSMTDEAIKTIRLRKKDHIAPPLEGSLGWARDLRYIMDIGLCLVESVEIKNAEPKHVFGWVMKDRDSGNSKKVGMLYYKKNQTFKPGPQV